MFDTIGGAPTNKAISLCALHGLKMRVRERMV
jgi:hypothetical protein